MTAPSDRDRASLPSGCNPSRIDAKRGDHFLQADLPGLELALPRLIFYCDIHPLAGDPAKLAHYFQIQEGQLKTKAVPDPRAAVAVDVAALRAIPALPGAWLISGLVYDVAPGLVEIVLPPAPIRTAQNS